MGTQMADDPLHRGHEALAAADWERARVCFEQARELGETAEVLDGLSQAAHFQGRHTEAMELKERAFAAYRRGGKRPAAAEAARWLAFLHGAVHGNRAAANGWMVRAERLFEGVEESVEHGRLALDRAPWTDDPAERERHAMTAVTIARRFGDRDLEFSAQALLGHAYVLSGRVAEGMSLIDEAMAARSPAARWPLSTRSARSTAGCWARASAQRTSGARSSGLPLRDASSPGAISWRRPAGSTTAGS